MKRWLLLGVAPLFLLVFGCAHVISKDALREVEPGIDFAQIKAKPEAYKGKTLLLGGLIVENQLDREGTTLEVLRYSLDRWGEPRKVDEQGGRFLARTGRFLDPELYKPGLFITLTGTVVGSEVHPLKKYEYVYPVFQIGEVYVWSRRTQAYPYGYYDPYYPWGAYGPYPYYYGDPFWYHRDPFWYDPYWPHRRWPGW